MINNSKQEQSDILITIRRSYGNSDSESLLPQLDNFGIGRSNLSFEVEILHNDSTKALNLIKSFILLLLISSLPSEALLETVQNLEQIKEFYTDFAPEDSQSTITTEVVTGKIVSIETRHPLVLAWD